MGIQDAANVLLKAGNIDYFSNYTLCKEKSVSTTQLMGFCKTYILHMKSYVTLLCT
jgi:hypothetical protein